MNNITPPKLRSESRSIECNDVYRIAFKFIVRIKKTLKNLYPSNVTFSQHSARLAIFLFHNAVIEFNGHFCFLFLFRATYIKF